MKKFLKIILLMTTLFAGLTGCSHTQSGASSDNLESEVIIGQIKERMKEEMDRIGFEVDLDNYKFYVYTNQTGATFGTVSMHDKRYPVYGALEVYRGTFGSKKKNQPIDKRLVATNPIIFVMNGYQDYTVKHIFNNKDLGNDVDGALKAVGGKITTYSAGFSYDGLKETEKNAVKETTELKLLDDIAVTSFLYSYSEKSIEEYVRYFKGKNSTEFNYEALIDNFNLKSRAGIYINVTEDEREQKQKEMRKYYNPETLVIVLTTAEALVKK